MEQCQKDVFSYSMYVCMCYPTFLIKFLKGSRFVFDFSPQVVKIHVISYLGYVASSANQLGCRDVKFPVLILYSC